MEEGKIIKKDIENEISKDLEKEETDAINSFNTLVNASKNFINKIDEIAKNLTLYNSEIEKADSAYDKVNKLYQARNKINKNDNEIERNLGIALLNYQKAVDKFFNRNTVLTIVDENGHIIFTDKGTERKIMKNLEKDYRNTTGSASMRAYKYIDKNATALSKKLQDRINKSEQNKKEIFSAARRRYRSDHNMYFFYRHFTNESGEDRKRRVFHYKNHYPKTKMHDIVEYYALAVLTDDKDVNKGATLVNGAKSQVPYFEKENSREKDLENSMYEAPLENLYYKYILQAKHDSIPALVKADIRGSDLSLKGILKEIQNYEFAIKYGYTARIEKIGQFINMAYFILKAKEHGIKELKNIKDETLKEIAKTNKIEEYAEEFFNNYEKNLTL